MSETKHLEYFLPKQVGYTAGIAAILLLIYSILGHIYFDELIADRQNLSLMYIGALIIFIGSKMSMEDERLREIRNFSMTVSAGLLIGFLFWREMKGDWDSNVSVLSAVLTIYCIQLLYLMNYGPGKLLKNRTRHGWFIIISFLTCMLTFDWLWAA